MEKVEGLGVSVATELTKPLVEQVLDQFRYMFCFNKFVQDLEKQENDFEVVQAKVRLKVEAAERDAEVIVEVVKKWLTKVDTIINELQHFKTTIQQERRCLSKCFPNLLWRYQRSKEAANLAEELKELGQRGNNFGESVSHPVPRQNIEFLLSEFVMSKTAEAVVNEVMAALKDDGVDTIGLYGMGGVGKTTLVKGIAKKVKESKLFKEVLMVVVSQDSSILRMQDKFADMMGLKFDKETATERAEKLWRRFENLDKVFIVLDDVWQELPLQGIGVPFIKEHGWKILLTTRRLRICRVMKCQKEVQLDVLNTDEGWTLFKEIACLSDNSHLNDVARMVAGECGGLPIAIVTVAKALIGKPRVEWLVALDQLKKSQLSDIVDMDEDKNAYKCLKWSYDCLRKQEMKLCFLLCSLFPEDYEIPVVDLARYAIGLGLYDDVDSIEDARKRVIVAVGHLKDCCMLSKAESEENVKMHDVVRDFAKWIGNKIEKLHRERSEAGLEGNMVAISSMDNDLNKFWGKINNPIIEILELSRKGPSREGSINDPHKPFEQLEEIKDLSLVHGSLPLESVGDLKNLQTLELKFLEFHIITSSLASLGKLNRLKILSFRGSTIEELPEELGELSNLRLLDLTFCEQLKTIPLDMIRRLYKLEELYIGSSSFKNWEIEGENRSRSNASLMELSSLSHLAILWLKVEDSCIPENFVFAKRLKQFSIHISCGCIDDNGEDSYPRSREICFSPTNVAMNSCKELLQNACIISCHHDRQRIPSMTPDISQWGCKDLASLELSDTEMEYLIHMNQPLVPATTFSFLEELRLWETNLKEICNGQPPEGFLQKLRKIKVDVSHNMHTIFPLKLWRALENLESIALRRCDGVQELFQLDGFDDIAANEGKVLLSQLTEINLHSLPEVRCIWKGPTRCVSLEGLKDFTLKLCGSLTSLFSPSLARSLVHLESINIFGCDQLEQIIKEEDEEGAITSSKTHSASLSSFQNLRTLTIDCCPRLEYVIPISFASHLLHLERIKILGCPELKRIFGKERREVAVARGNEKMHHHHHPQEEIRQLECSSKIGYFYCSGDSAVMLPSLRKIKIKDCPKLCAYSIASQSQTNSKIVKVKDSEESRLESLILCECNEIDHIITKDDDDKNYQNGLGSPMHSVCFICLEKIHIFSCNKLKTIFPFTISQGIPLLRYFVVERCDQLVEILASGDDEGEDIDHKNDQIIMPKLESLTLQDLPSLVSFCPAGYRCIFPSLTKLEVEKCPKAMTSFIIQPNSHIETRTQKPPEINEAATSASGSMSTQPTILLLSTNRRVRWTLYGGMHEEEEEEEENDDDDDDEQSTVCCEGSPLLEKLTQTEEEEEDDDGQSMVCCAGSPSLEKLTQREEEEEEEAADDDSSSPAPRNLEIERTVRRLRKERREAIQAQKSKQEEPVELLEMEEEVAQLAHANNNRALRDYAIPNLLGAQSSVIRLTVAGNNFELKLALINMVQQNQFSSLDSEDPNAHLSYFLQICCNDPISKISNSLN